jgi:Flp pilus assembly protein TadD
MIVAALIAAGVVAAAPAPAVAPAVAPARYSLTDAAHAIEAGRLDQARMMISRALAAGATEAQAARPLADLAFAEGNNAEALARYQWLLATAPGDSRLCERAGIAALRLGDAARAASLIICATKPANASWRGWNARGVLADMQSDWDEADRAYERAAQLAPNEAEIANNQGWSQLLRGNWQAAAFRLERAAALDPRSKRIANNLELARAALADGLPERRSGESGRAWAERLNDAGVAAQLRGDKARAVAAFSQALEASETWYPRAANNLQVAGGGR